MADEVTPTETSAPTETTDAPAADDVLASTALGGGGETDAPAETVDGDASAAADEKPAETSEKVVPETYELSPPEGMALDADTLALATPVFKDLGLTNEQAQSLIPVAGQFAQKITDANNAQLLASVATQRKEWFDTSKADPEIGGANWDKSVSTADVALVRLGYPKGSPLRNLLDDSGLGNHPEMIRAFKRVGDAIGEDASFARSDTTGSTSRTDAELFYGNPKT